jgi:thiamine monophosphate kinase
LGDGEDHELLAALPRRALARVLAEAPARCPGLVEVGRVRRGGGVWVPRDEHGGALARWDGAGGWVHGG